MLERVRKNQGDRGIGLLLGAFRREEFRNTVAKVAFRLGKAQLTK